MTAHTMKNVNFATPTRLEEMIDYQKGKIISCTLAQIPQANVTLFSLYQGEGISSHTAAGDAMVLVLDGEAEVTIGEEVFTVKEGEAIFMPRDIPHALEAREKFKMLLVVIKG